MGKVPAFEAFLSKSFCFDMLFVLVSVYSFFTLRRFTNAFLECDLVSLGLGWWANVP
jgi:hypothetical protein